MESSHSSRTHAHHQEPDPHHNPAEGEDEKKSVLKKVKAKAQKIKNTLTKHGHGHDHQDPGREEYEVEDEDEEIVEDPEIHSAPIYESAAVRSAVLGPIGHPWANLERPSVMAEDRYDSKMADPPVRPCNQWQEEEHGQPKGNSSRLTAKDDVHHLPEDKHVPFSTGIYDIENRNPTRKILHGQEDSPGQERNKIGFPTAVEGIRGSNGENSIGQELNLGGQMGRIGMGTGMEEDPNCPGLRNVPSHVQAKTIDPNGRGSEEAAGITPILRSFDKLGMYDNPEQKPKSGESLYTGSHEQFAPEPLHHENPVSDLKSCDPNNPQDLPGNTSTGNPSSHSSTYAEKLTSAASSIADTAKSAKNVVASKLGYRGNESTGAPHEEVQGQGDSTKPSSAKDYAHKIAATVTETLAPVYGKVAGAGSTIVSKVQGTVTGSDNEGQDKGVSVKEYLAEKLKPGEEDKALSEMITGSFTKHKTEIEKKTRAGEEVTTGGGRGVSEVISDALHKRELEGSGDGKTMGKVTESEEVAKRLGTGGEEEMEKVAKLLGGGEEEEGGGKGVVDRVKGAVGSWLGGKGGDTQTTPGTTYAGDNDNEGKNASE